MPYCSRCGVEVEPQTPECPLCDAPIQRLPGDDSRPWPHDEAPKHSAPALSADERQALAKSITSLGFLIPVAIVLTVDWFVTRSITWSLWPLVTLGAAWLWALIPIALGRKPHLMITSITVVGIALLWGLGWLSGSVRWVITIGMPLVIIAGILANLILLLARHRKHIGSNLAGWILIAITILNICADVLVRLNFQLSGVPGWSLIVAATLLPVAALLLYLHYRPSRKARLRRYFHV
ncbi:MAG: DUF6320 domain-containing protein [Spirochaetales bacterium]|nr:DUF6320 domain-containing protein [Spirochaetales bacterium]